MIIRPALPFWLGAALAGVAALETVSDAATWCTLCWPCVVEDRKTWVFSAAVAPFPAYTLMTLATNLQHINAWNQPEQPARPDRGEPLIARWLHRVEGGYRTLEQTDKIWRQTIHALTEQWLNQVELPAEGITILEQGQPLQAEALTLDERGEGVLCLVPAILTAIAVILWLLFLYWYWAFAMLLFTNERPIEQSVNGARLIAIVATESLAITWVLLAHGHAGLMPALQFLSCVFWTFGVFLYLISLPLLPIAFSLAVSVPLISRRRTG